MFTGDSGRVGASPPLDPITPKEYLEAIRRIAEWAMENDLTDGDGVTKSPEDKDQTLTDMFFIIAGAAYEARMEIAKWKRLREEM